jgi:large subunit ribosomal protein L10
VNKTEKNEFVTWMKAEMTVAPSVVVAEYRGLTVAQLSSLRARCRDSGVKFKVVKNTLMKLALKDTDLASAAQVLDGPTAVAWHLDDPGAPARVLIAFAKEKTNEALKIKGGGVRGRALAEAEVRNVLATLPTRPELLGTLVGMINSGPQKLHGVLSAAPIKMARLLAALKDQRESQGGQAPPPPAAPEAAAAPAESEPAPAAT